MALKSFKSGTEFRRAGRPIVSLFLVLVLLKSVQIEILLLPYIPENVRIYNHSHRVS